LAWTDQSVPWRVTIFNKVWDTIFVVNGGDSENHQSPPLQMSASTLVVVKEISLLPVQASEADGIILGVVGITCLYIKPDALAGRAL
jgi:hypothetical protein